MQYVKLGDLNLSSDRDDAQPVTFNIEERIRHPDYTSKSHYNDIALLKVSILITLNPYVRPACLPIERQVPGKAIATGWGRTEHNGDSSETLLKVTLESFSFLECNESYKFNINRKFKEGIVDDSQICYGSKTEKKDTCQGDSGGPLQIYQPNDIYCMYELLGVTSFGRICGTVNSPGVYTRVWKYIDWLESVLWPEDV